MLRKEPTTYSVVWPRGEKTQEIAPLATRLDSLERKDRWIRLGLSVPRR